jgi:glycine/D-amino acid oxidase-like deaminating enzyme
MRADLVVIGAGALGLSTALHAALAGKSVVVVDAHAAGSQASGRAAGLFKSVQADELRTWLARRSIERAISFADWAGAELEVIRSGSFLIARTDEHRAYLRTEARQSGTWGVDVSEASPGQLAEGLSYYHGNGHELALWCPQDIYIEEPMSLVQAYVAACRTHGVEILETEPVTGITLSGGKVAGVQTTAQTIDTRLAVDAAGAWTRQLADLAGGRVCVAPVRHQLAITEPSAAIDSGDPICRVVDAAVYLRPARGGMMVGGFEQAPLPVDPRGATPSASTASFTTDDVPLDLAVLRRLAGQVESEVPQATGLEVAEHRGGMFTMSPDGRFVAGPVPQVPGLWTATGCNGSGFSSSLGLGEALAEWIVNDPPSPRIAALTPARFGPMTDDELVNAGIWQYAHYYDPV